MLSNLSGPHVVTRGGELFAYQTQDIWSLTAQMLAVTTQFLPTHEGISEPSRWLHQASLVSGLQDSTRYDKTQKLLEKYDPEYVPSSPSRGFSNSTHFAPPSTPGLRHRHVSHMQAQSNTGMMSPLAGTASPLCPHLPHHPVCCCIQLYQPIYMVNVQQC